MTLNLNIQPTDATDALRLARCWDKAQRLGREGYSVAQSKTSHRLFFVFKPVGLFYTVNAELHTCDCDDFKRHGRYCKHTLFVARCLAHIAKIEREAEWEAIDREEANREAYEEYIAEREAREE